MYKETSIDHRSKSFNIKVYKRNGLILFAKKCLVCSVVVCFSSRVLFRLVLVFVVNYRVLSSLTIHLLRNRELWLLGLYCSD